MEEDEGGGEPREEGKEGAGGRRNGDGDSEDGGGGEADEDGDNANGGDEDGSATDKGISLKKHRPKKRRGPKMGMPSSKRKRHDGDDGATNRDPAILAMLRLDDLSPLDLATLMSFSEEASGGLGGAARSRRVLHLAHPRVTEHPYHGSLRSYVLGQLKAMSGQGGGRNLLHSERFAGFAGLMYSMSGVLSLQREGAAEARRVARELFSDVDVVEGLVHVTVRFLVGEMPQNRTPQMGAGVGKATEEGQEMEKALVLKVSNLLGMAHNLLSYELEDGEERVFWVSLERLRVMQALTVSSLDILDMQVRVLPVRHSTVPRVYSCFLSRHSRHAHACHAIQSSPFHSTLVSLPGIHRPSLDGQATMRARGRVKLGLHRQSRGHDPRRLSCHLHGSDQNAMWYNTIQHNNRCLNMGRNEVPKTRCARPCTTSRAVGWERSGGRRRRSSRALSRSGMTYLWAALLRGTPGGLASRCSTGIGISSRWRPRQLIFRCLLILIAYTTHESPSGGAR